MTKRAFLLPLLLAVSAYLAGCSTTPPVRPDRQADAPSGSFTPPFRGGGYYKDDGPSLNPPANLAQVPDAVPRHEPLHRFANNPYRVLGRLYTPMTDNRGYRQSGMASWYGRKFHGRPTSSGEIYDMYAMTAAHPTLPIPSFARVTNNATGQSIVVRINDRGPFIDNRLIDLSYAAAYRLGTLRQVTPVTVEAVFADDTEFAHLAARSAAPEPQPAARAPSVPPAPPAAVPAGAEMYYLQFGAFASRERANALLDRLTTRLSRRVCEEIVASGPSARRPERSDETYQVDRRGASTAQHCNRDAQQIHSQALSFPGVLRITQGGLYRVQGGPFASLDAADAAALRLRDELGIASFRVRGEPPPEAAAPAPGLYLQLAALSSQDAAQRLGERVRARFGAELPGLTQVHFDGLIRVQVGPFASPAAAQRMRLAYQQDFGIRPHTVMH